MVDEPCVRLRIQWGLPSFYLPIFLEDRGTLGIEIIWDFSLAKSGFDEIELRQDSLVQDLCLKPFQGSNSAEVGSKERKTWVSLSDPRQRSIPYSSMSSV